MKQKEMKKDNVMSYIYETHLHTVESSACGKSHGADYLKAYQDLGFSGIIVTDHFFNGNCAVPAGLPWKDRVELFCRGYELAKEAGDKINFPVFFGWEDCFEKDEYLVYGLDKQWLLEHPDMLTWDQKRHYEEIHKDGGLVIQAHPFRERDYITNINLHPYQCDGWEIANACNPVSTNYPAFEYAKRHHMMVTAGSDIHLVNQALHKECFGVSFDEPLQSIQDFVALMKAGKGTVYLPEDIFAGEPFPEQAGLPIRLFNEKNEYHNVTMKDLFT